MEGVHILHHTPYNIRYGTIPYMLLGRPRRVTLNRDFESCPTERLLCTCRSMVCDLRLWYGMTPYTGEQELLLLGWTKTISDQSSCFGSCAWWND
eukprot:scaffold9085_cov215-Amphora_coffeaeformis.AAC.10